MRTFVKWFKIRFLFDDEELLAAFKIFGMADREKLNDDRLWEDCQKNTMIIARELTRRNIAFWKE